MRWRRWIPLLIYAGLGAALISTQPGLQYDEALLVSGGVHLTHSRTEYPLQHAPHTWVCRLGPCFPIMAEGRYIGPIKEYLVAPLFWAFGPRTGIVRGVSLVLGGVGLWGVYEILAEPVAFWITLALAVSPTYLMMVTFDNGAVAAMMAAFGLLCGAIARYIRGPSWMNAAWIGIAAGFGVWARANFVWLLAAMVVASVVVLRPRIPRAHLLTCIAGCALGAFPFLVYQVLSHGGTLEAAALLGSQEHALFSRVVLFSESLMIDREHRAMWGSLGPLAYWQSILFTTMLIVAAGLCWRRKWKGAALARCSMVALLVLLGFLFSTRMEIGEHHLVAALPLAIVVVGSVYGLALREWRLPVLFLAAVYFVTAVVWDARTFAGLMKTGGVGPWSDAVFELENVLRDKHSKDAVQITGWGLEQNLFVLSDEQLPLKELFWDPKDWDEEIRNGGIFVAPGPANRQGPDATPAFLAALGRMGVEPEVTNVAQRNGVVYAQVLDLRPEHRPIVLHATAPDFDRLTTGFYGLEAGAWRWTKRTFSARMTNPGFEKPWVELRFFLPEALRTGVTLHARVDGRELPAHRYDTGDQQIYEAPLEFAGRDALIEFELDRGTVIPGDGRELGVVVTEIGIHSR